MEFVTATEWDERLWNAIEGVYVEAFPHGRKNKRIVKTLQQTEQGFLHAAYEDDVVVAMALTAPLKDINALLIDYLSVRETMRGRGIGMRFVDGMKNWAKTLGYDAIVIEVECSRPDERETAENERRIHFWQRCGFILTDYVHDYKIVPELYRALYAPLAEQACHRLDGPTIFRHMTRYHKQAWGKGNRGGNLL